MLHLPSSPYTVKRRPINIFRSDLYFEDTLIGSVSTVDVEPLLTWLQASYQLGYGSGFIDGQLEEKRS